MLRVANVLVLGLSLAACSVSGYGACMTVSQDPMLQIDPSAKAAMAGAKLAVKDFYSVMQVVSRYETGGC